MARQPGDAARQSRRRRSRTNASSRSSRRGTAARSRASRRSSPVRAARGASTSSRRSAPRTRRSSAAAAPRRRFSSGRRSRSARSRSDGLRHTSPLSIRSGAVSCSSSGTGPTAAGSRSRGRGSARARRPSSVRCFHVGGRSLRVAIGSGGWLPRRVQPHGLVPPLAPLAPAAAAAFGADEPPEKHDDQRDGDRRRGDVHDEGSVAHVRSEDALAGARRGGDRRADQQAGEQDRGGDQPRDGLEAPRVAVEVGEADADGDLASGQLVDPPSRRLPPSRAGARPPLRRRGLPACAPRRGWRPC